MAVVLSYIFYYYNYQKYSFLQAVFSLVIFAKYSQGTRFNLFDSMINIIHNSDVLLFLKDLTYG